MAVGGLHLDLRGALRGVLRRKAESLFVVFVLALAIGLLTAMFAILWGTLWRGLPFAGGERLMRLQVTDAETGEEVGATLDDFERWRAGLRSFEAVTGWVGAAMTVSGAGGPAERRNGAYVAPDFFATVGVAPLLGRGFALDEDKEGEPGAPAAAVLGYDLWQARFGGDPEIVGQTIRVWHQPTKVVGVMPPGFRFPLQQDVWVAWGSLWAGVAPDLRGSRRVEVLGRLGRPEDRRRAAAELELVGLAPAAGQGSARRVAVRPFVDAYAAHARRPLYLGLAVAGAVLLLACANVAFLLLARAVARRREVAIRAALGATRARLLTLALGETAWLGLAGVLLGILIAHAAVGAYEELGGLVSSFWVDVRIDSAVLAFAAAAAAAAVVLTASLPALGAVRLEVVAALHATPGRTSGRRVLRLGSALVVSQVAISFGLLVSTGLLVRSLQRVVDLDFGQAPDQVLVASLNLYGRPLADVAGRQRFFDDLLRRLEAVGGTEAVALASGLPGDRTPRVAVEVDGAVAAPGTGERTARWAAVTPEFFATLGRGVRRGRPFAASDDGGSAPVALVNESFTRRFLAGHDPLGQRVRLQGSSGWGPWLTVVGVVPDLFVGSDPYDPKILDERHREGLYLPFAQRTPMGASLLLRTSPPPAALAPQVRAAVAALDPELPLARVGTLAEHARALAGDHRLYATLLSALSAAALALALAGLYGLVSLSVRRRIPELGLRAALGARAGDLRRLVLVGAARHLTLGLVLGYALALGLGRAVRSLLFGVAPGDAPSFLMAAALLVAASLAAAWAPARRAARQDPLTALRAE